MTPLKALIFREGIVTFLVVSGTMLSGMAGLGHALTSNINSVIDRMRFVRQCGTQ